MKIRAIILSALILCGISAVIMYSRAAQPQQKSSVIIGWIRGYYKE